MRTSLLALLGSLDRGPRRFLVFLFFNVISWQCIIGPVLVLHARAAGIDRATVGVLNSILFFAGILGLLTKPLAERFGSKRLLMTGWTVRNLVVLPIVLTPWVYARYGTPGAARLLFATAGLFCITRAMAGIAWSSWLHEIVPPNQLGRFFAAETILTRLLSVMTGVVCFVVLGRNPPLWRFAALASFGVAAGLVSIRLLRRVPGGEPPRREDGTPAMPGGFGLVLRDRAFMRFLGCTALFGFVFAGQALLVTLLLRDRLLLGPGLILLLVSSGSAVTIATTASWRRLADRQGSPRAMALAGSLMVLGLAIAACLRPGHAPLALIMLLCALVPVAESGSYVATSRGYMLRMRPELRHVTNAVWSAGTAFGGGVSSVLMGFWLRHGELAHFRIAAWSYAGIMLMGVWWTLHTPEEVC